VDPDARPKSASAFLALTDTTLPQPARRRTRLPIVAAIAATAALLVFVVWQFVNDQSAGRRRILSGSPPPAIVEIGPQIKENGAKVHDALGRAAFDAGRYDDALTELLQIDEDLRTAPILYTIAQAYRLTGNLHQAVYFYRRTIAEVDRSGRSFPAREDAETYIKEIEARVNTTGRRFVEEDADNYARGRDAYSAGRYDEAITWFLKVDEAQRTPEMTFNMAQAYRRKGDLHQALFHYRRFLEAADLESTSPRTIEQVRTYIKELEAATAADAGVAP
jgi:tetratricopeptide (TPR) repeat protein